ncbi:MAG: S1C family serine protease [Thermomicrobiales bacterium]
MSSLPDNSYIPISQKSYAARAKRYVLSLGLVAAVAFGVAQSSLAAPTTDTTTPPAATAEATINSATGSTSFSVADVAQQANPAVVTIYTYGTPSSSTNSKSQLPSGNQGNSSESSTPQELGAGSGWIFDAQGHVITNNHVVEGADSFVVQYADGTKVYATLVGTDTFQDVAVLQLNLKNGATVPGVATVGNSADMRAGDQVVAIGSPLGEFTNSVSEGIIGGLNRSLDTGSGYALGHLIQHDAPISPGNSGGPLLNMQGQVIGMNVAKVDYQQSGQPSASGLGFAIDGNTVKGIVDQIISNSGNVVYPYFGVSSQELQDGTVQVAKVETGSPADTAGLQAGDVITQVDGKDVSTDSPLLNLLIAHKPGDEVKLTIERNGQTQTISVTLGTRPSGV